MTTEHASRRRFLQASGVAAVTALAGCGGGGGTDEAADIDADYVYDLGGSSHEDGVEITVGQSILWRAESGQHFVRLRDKPDESEWSPPAGTAISSDQTHKHTFEVAGTYQWDCDYHRGPYTFEVTE